MDEINEATYTMFAIIGSHTEYANYFAVPVSYISGSTSFDDGLDVIITFARTGDKGDTGDQGTQGVQGLQGVQGTQGLQGAQGTQGIQGASIQGTAGTSVTILGSYNSLAELEAAHPTGTGGDGYIIDPYLYVWLSGAWTNVGVIQGPQGVQGLQVRHLRAVWRSTPWWRLGTGQA